MDAALGEHLRPLTDETTVLVLLSHGMSAHHDGTHLLPEILRRLDRAYRGAEPRSPWGAALGRAWLAAPAGWRERGRAPLARLLRRRLAQVQLDHARDFDTDDERRSQAFFMSPNNFVVGGVRINLRGRERDGLVAPGSELDELCERLRHDLLALVNVETGTPVVTAVERADRYYRRGQLDALPDLFLEWNHERPIEAIWSPRLGLIRGPYTHWRTGDHRPGGMLLVRAPGVEPRSALPPLAIEDLGPSISAALGVELPDVDGRPAPWARQLAPSGYTVARPSAIA
jgi:hypothetical protein